MLQSTATMDTGSDYLRQAAEIVKRWLKYASIDVILDMPGNRKLDDDGPCYGDWRPDDEQESTWTFRYPGHPLDGLTVPVEIFWDTYLFTRHKNEIGMIVGQSDEVFSHAFVSEDRSRRLTIEDLRPYIPDICA